MAWCLTSLSVWWESKDISAVMRFRWVKPVQALHTELSQLCDELECTRERGEDTTVVTVELEEIRFISLEHR